MKRRWTKDERLFLKDNYGNLSPLQCAYKLPGRTKNAVKKMAKRLNLVKTYTFLSGNEIFYIKSNYSQHGPVKISKHIGAERDSVYHVAQRLGLKMDPKSRGKISSESNLGRIVSKSTRKKMSIANTKYLEPNKCIDCGKEITRKSSRCKPCSGKTRSGEKHMWWRGGVSSLYQIVAHMLYPMWKYPILCRDNFTCQNCGLHDYLEVHHLRYFVEIRDMVLKDNPNLSLNVLRDKKRLAKLIVAEHEIEDGVTFCYPCHSAIHRDKQGELQGTPTMKDEDNLQPSPSNVISIVGGKVQRLTDEDTQTNKSDTSALAVKSLGGMK